jgi:AcrR family transcriptional regulator
VEPGRKGRPRSAQVRVAVVRAAAQLTLAGGPAAATVDAIAKRAAVSRTTIYKWWPSSAAIVLEGLLDSVPDPIIAPPGSSSKEALDHHLRPLDAVLTDTRPRVASVRPARRRRLVRRPPSTGPTLYPPRALQRHSNNESPPRSALNRVGAVANLGPALLRACDGSPVPSNKHPEPAAP